VQDTVYRKALRNTLAVLRCRSCYSQDPL